MTLALPARAKLNLDLEVIRRREDGYHDVRTTLQAIDLHDLLEAEPAAETYLTMEGLTLSASGENAVLKAHRALEQTVRKSLPTRFHLDKRIPPGSGLGGASSDAAAALRLLVAMHRLEVELEPIAQELGADVSFFLHGGRARGGGRGDRLTQEQVEKSWFALAWPGIELLTPDVYRAWDEVGGNGPNHLRLAAEHVEPRVAGFVRKLGEDWQMTGSGSAFFVCCASHDDAAQAVKHLDCWTAVAQAVGPW